VGYSAILNSSDDSLAILSDESSGSWQSSEWYDGEFHYMYEAWQGVNFLIRVIIETMEGIEILGGSGLTDDNQLIQAYPNPFNSQTNIVINLENPGFISLNIYDVLGRQIERLYSGYKGSGRLVFPVNAAAWGSGAYFVQMNSRSQQTVHRIILEK